MGQIEHCSLVNVYTLTFLNLRKCLRPCPDNLSDSYSRAQGCLSHSNHDQKNEEKVICNIDHSHILIDMFFKTKQECDWYLYNSKFDGMLSIRTSYNTKDSRTVYHTCRCTDLRYPVRRGDSVKSEEGCKAKLVVKEFMDEKININATIKGWLSHSHAV